MTSRSRYIDNLEKEYIENLRYKDLPLYLVGITDAELYLCLPREETQRIISESRAVAEHNKAPRGSLV